MTTDPNTGLPLNQYMASQIANPTLPNGTVATPVLMQDSAAQNMNPNTPGLTLPTTGTNITAPPPVVAPTITPQTGTAATVNPNDVTSLINPTAGTYTATQASPNTPQGVAEQGTVSPQATVQGQLAQLYASIIPGTTPEWAKGAVVKANEVMAARGMGASSIGGAAIFAAVQNSALPIAAADAATYFQMDMTNLSNRQSTMLENLKNQQQSLLSDQAAENASKQFNASSTAQIQQFMATMVSNIQTQNADRFQAMSQFNLGQVNQAGMQNVANQINVGQFNSQQQAAIDQFNSQQTFARESFNAQAAFAIEQSNVLWRRNLNTANTAAANATNQLNVQNSFDMSQIAQNQLWQQWRDEASWSFTASENQKNRDFNAAMAANNRQYNGDDGFNWANAAGSFVSGLLV